MSIDQAAFWLMDRGHGDSAIWLLEVTSDTH